jgi:hypothetical protein
VASRFRTPLVIAAALLWGITMPALLDPGLALRFGADFVHYYTWGWLALNRAGEGLYDPASFHAAQAALVPALAHLQYPTVYPPQAGPVFAPLALLPYRAASFAWMILTAITYAVVIKHAASRAQMLNRDRVLLWVAAITFPPFWYLVLFRQNSILLLIAFYVGSQLLEREKPGWAGLVLGTLALKPQFGLPLAVFAVCRRDARLILGAVASVLAQGVIAAGVFGRHAIADFITHIPTIAASANTVEPFLYKSLSLRTFSRLLPSPMGEIVWIVACGLVLFALVRLVRARVPMRLLMGLVIVASVLVNPHVYVYDGVVLVIPFIWLGEWWLERRHGRWLLYGILGFWTAGLLMMPLTLVFGSAPAIAATISAISILAAFYWATAKALYHSYRPVDSASLVQALA